MTQGNIIPFPARPSAQQERLQSSLASLQSALEEQRRALRDWRFAMAELGISVAGLGASLGNYQQTLGGVEAKLTELHEHSARLEDWADGVLTESARDSSEASSPG
jgi:chromosome segregation ATPase